MSHIDHLTDADIDAMREENAKLRECLQDMVSTISGYTVGSGEMRCVKAARALLAARPAPGVQERQTKKETL